MNELKIYIFFGIVLSALSVQASVYPISEGQKIIGELKVVLAGHNDTFISIAKEFDLGYEELVAANPGIDPWLVKEGTKIYLPLQFILPQVRKGIHINLAEYRLYYFAEDNADQVWSFPVSIGRGEWQTPTGQITVVDKIINPNWYPPESIRAEHALEGDLLPRIVLPGPDNPLGKYALQLSADGYFIHGTNRPYGIGMRVTHGCIRLRPKDIKTLFDKVPRDYTVYITYEPFKFAVENNRIYFEVHPKQSTAAEENSRKWMRAMSELLNLAKDTGQLIDRKKLFNLTTLREGMPQIINLGAITEETALSEVTRLTTGTKSVAEDNTAGQMIF